VLDGYLPADLNDNHNHNNNNHTDLQHRPRHSFARSYRPLGRCRNR
jgi:hypothetical protein